MTEQRLYLHALSCSAHFMYRLICSDEQGFSDALIFKVFKKMKYELHLNPPDVPFLSFETGLSMTDG